MKEKISWRYDWWVLVAVVLCAAAIYLAKVGYAWEGVALAGLSAVLAFWGNRQGLKRLKTQNGGNNNE